MNERKYFISMVAFFVFCCVVMAICIASGQLK
jgi:low affinity Fe/Cu permease